jgi:hypothetical protein
MSTSGKPTSQMSTPENVAMDRLGFAWTQSSNAGNASLTPFGVLRTSLFLSNELLNQ